MLIDEDSREKYKKILHPCIDPAYSPLLDNKKANNIVSAHLLICYSIMSTNNTVRNKQTLKCETFARSPIPSTTLLRSDILQKLKKTL